MRAQYIYEKFTQESDPIHDMEIGTVKKIKEWLKKYSNYITDPKINRNLTISCSGTLNFYGVPIIELPEYIKFYKVKYDLSFYGSQLKSLNGFPKYVERNVYLGNNHLTSLKGLPTNGSKNIIYKDLMLFRNDLTSLKGCPDRVNGSFNCMHNPLKSLDGMPKYIGHDFVCYPPMFDEIYIRQYLKENNIYIGHKAVITRQFAKEEQYI